jgi:hypothetical protein
LKTFKSPKAPNGDVVKKRVYHKSKVIRAPSRFVYTSNVNELLMLYEDFLEDLKE